MWIENERLSEKNAETHLTRSRLHSREAERRPGTLVSSSKFYPPSVPAQC